jgi:hemoglobin
MLRARHLPFPIGAAEADAWVWCMERALDAHELPEDFRAYLKDRFRAIATHMRNR